MDSSQFGALCDQQRQEGAEQAFTSDANIMHELKEAQVQRQLLLREAAMRSQPGTEQRPKALHRVDMNFMEAIPVLVTGVFTPAMTHRMMIKAPVLQRVIDGIFIGMDARSRRNERLDQGANRGLLDILDHPDDHRATPLNHAENRWFFGRQGSPTPRPLQPPPPTLPAGAAHRFRLSLVAGDDVNLVAFHLPRQDRFGLAQHDPIPQLLGHPLRIAGVQPQFLGDLSVREVQSHEIQTQNPH